jgi:flagellar L-ring protein precursor FlgH
MRRVFELVPLALWIAALPASGESLYQEGSYRALAADLKASRVGDAITVQVYENSSASSTAETSTRRTNDLSVSADFSRVSPVSIKRQLGANLETSGSFEGGGTTQRVNRLLATITTTVQEVLANGDLRIAGEQLLTVNDEQHKVRVEGRVRPQDISSDNVVLSTRLSDARIFYSGDGDLSERSRRAWWRKILDFLGL